MASGTPGVRVMAEERWTASRVEARMADAADVLKRLPEDRVQGYVSAWPEIVRSVHESFGWQEPVLKRPWPSPGSIDRMDEAMRWLAWLEPVDARIVWERAAKTRWKPICYRVGMTRATAWRHWVAGLALIALRLNGESRLPAGIRAPRAAGHRSMRANSLRIRQNA